MGLDDDGVKLNVYGRGKTGKTRLACSFPKPLLLIGTEKGTKSVAKTAGIDFVKLKNADELVDLTDMLKTTKKYKSAVIDTGGGYQDLVLKDVLGLDELPQQRSWGMAQQGDWQIVASQFKEKVKGFFDLSELGIHAVLIAHERVLSTDQVSDVMIPSVGSALTPTLINWVNGECDYIGQMFIREGIEEKRIKEGKKVRIRKVPTGKKEYCLRIGPHEIFMTGFRIPEGVTLPDVIVNPTYDKIATLIRGETL